MAQMQGAYRLGKAIAEGIAGLKDSVEVTESGGIAQSQANYELTKNVILDAFREAGFFSQYLGLCALLNPKS